MVAWRPTRWLLSGVTLLLGAAVSAQEPTGSIRGVVLDKDFDAPLAGARVVAVEARLEARTTEQGNYLISQVPPGKYTLVFSKDGYVRQVRQDVVVAAGRLTEVDQALPGDFADLEEFVVQEVLQLGGAGEGALLQLRVESAAVLDSIGSELISAAGASDAASALRLVPGATVAQGKFAVIRGLPDRYVSSQLNNVRLPSADQETRAVELDQFPSAVIDSVQVSKTFTPDQQGDASGGAVNVRLKGVPDAPIFQVKLQTAYKTNFTGRSDFLTYDGGGVSFFGRDDGRRDVQPTGVNNSGAIWNGAVGVEEDDAPYDYKWSVAAGDRIELSDDVRVGAFGSVFYDRSNSFFDDGRDDQLWVLNPGEALTPQTSGDPPGDDNVFTTRLFDVVQATQSVQWGGVATLGLETPDDTLALAYLYTRTAEDTATLATDTRGKLSFLEQFYGPAAAANYDPYVITAPGNLFSDVGEAPYLRTETLDYQERTTHSLQLNGWHRITAVDEVSLWDDAFVIKQPELSWTASLNSASFHQPDMRQFGAMWRPPVNVPGFGVIPALWQPFKPSANFTLGNLQRIFMEIEEESRQYAVDFKVPFEQWKGDHGYLKTGVFRDAVVRNFHQETFSNFNDNTDFFGDFDQPWSQVFPTEGTHRISGSDFDVDYRGEQRISAWYGMLDMPLTRELNLIAGARFEKTKIGVKLAPEANATYFPFDPAQAATGQPTGPTKLLPTSPDANRTIEEDDVLPAIGLIYRPHRKVTLRASYSQTLARQTFRELTPVLQQEFLGAPVFIGNINLNLSSLENYDLRADYTPYEGALVSVSWFLKKLDDPIEYVQRVATFAFTQPRNYPEGELTGWEVEVRQSLGNFWRSLEGVSLGANATLIDSEVQLPADEVILFQNPALDVPFTSRDMLNAPEHLYNLFATWDIEPAGTRLGLFYTVTGDTLVAGAGQEQFNFIPNVYAKEYGTLNFSLSQRLGGGWRLQFQAKNLTNPEIEEVYRSEFTGPDVTKTSFTRGLEFTLGLSIDL